MALGGGFGSLAHMIQVMKYNRSLLPKRKKAKEIYREELKKLGTDHANVDIHLLRERVEKKLKRNRVEEVVGTFAVVLFVCLVISGFGWLIYIFMISSPPATEVNGIDNSKLFITTVVPYNDGLELRRDHFYGGPVASETYYKDGHKHQNSESYYQTGEQFRSALYYYDTLVTEVYLYRNGDTIMNFPVIEDKEVHRITMLNKQGTKRIEFKFFDHKIIKGSYIEVEIEK